jgi:hypothetical protein
MSDTATAIVGDGTSQSWFDMVTAGRVSTFWTSQAKAREIVAEHGCRLCTWKYPGEILDVSGDLWCHHCVREGLVELPLLEPARIPKP